MRGEHGQAWPKLLRRWSMVHRVESLNLAWFISARLPLCALVSKALYSFHASEDTFNPLVLGKRNSVTHMSKKKKKKKHCTWTCVPDTQCACKRMSLTSLSFYQEWKTISHLFLSSWKSFLLSYYCPVHGMLLLVYRWSLVPIYLILQQHFERLRTYKEDQEHSSWFEDEFIKDTRHREVRTV